MTICYTIMPMVLLDFQKTLSNTNTGKGPPTTASVTTRVAMTRRFAVTMAKELKGDNTNGEIEMTLPPLLS